MPEPKGGAFAQCPPPKYATGHTMCGSMADIQSSAAEIRRGKKKEDRNHRAKI